MTSTKVREAVILVGDISAWIARLPAVDSSQTIQINCDNLVRMDEQAAGLWLAWLRQLTNSERRVHLANMHRLLAVYLASLGLPAKLTLSVAAL